MTLLSQKLIAFQAVCTHKTVHRAAHSLNLTQTAVTQRIRTLEKSLQTTLFRRTRSGMFLTKEGEALQRYIQAARELEGQALAMIQGAGVEADIELTISAPTSIMHSRVIPQSLSVAKGYPRLLFRFDERDIEDRHLKLQKGECDLAILFGEHLSSQMCHKQLKPEQYVLVASYEWRNRSLKDILSTERIIDFNEQDQMTFQYLRQFNLLDLCNSGRHFVNQTESLAQLVIAGLGFTTLSAEFAERYVASHELVILNDAKTLDVTPILAWYDRPELATYFSELINTIS